MCSLAALRRLPAACRACPLARARAASRSSAGPAPPPPGPACRPRARPACRPAPPPCSGTKVVRVVCRAPPAGQRPPCDPRPPRPHLACSDAKSVKSGEGVASESDAGCGGQDRVARRLLAAAAARRRQYERAVREGACAPPPTPPAPPCLRATDGRTYPPPWVPPRTPPPPDLGTLSSESTCHHRGALDPCAHRPRTIVEVDRRPPTPAADTSLSPAPSTPAPSTGTCGSEPVPRGLAERIVAGLRGQPPRRALHTAPPSPCGRGGV